MGRPPAGLSGADEDFKARARAWGERCCLDQNLPFEITDRQALAKIADLLGMVPVPQRRKTARKRDSSKGAL